MNTHAVVCNEVEGTETVAPGSLCYVHHYSSETASVLLDVINNQGIWITLWRPYASLTNFRAKFTPEKHPKHIWARPATATKAKIAALHQALGPKS